MTSMFSKRHYEAVAAVLAKARPFVPASRLPTVGYPLRDAWTQLCADFGQMFAADNEKFNRTKWEEACER